MVSGCAVAIDPHERSSIRGAAFDVGKRSVRGHRQLRRAVAVDGHLAGDHDRWAGQFEMPHVERRGEDGIALHVQQVASRHVPRETGALDQGALRTAVRRADHDSCRALKGRTHHARRRPVVDGKKDRAVARQQGGLAMRGFTAGKCGDRTRLAAAC